MVWQTLIGHEKQQAWFRNAVRNNRLASTFLFVGPSGIGKRAFAKRLAKTLLCTARNPSEFDPCGTCETCVQIEASTHPDLLEIARQPDKTALSIDQFIGPEENRMREGLCYEIRMKPYSGRRKIAIIDDADTIGEEGANSLLKTLEEPPPGSVIVLISTSLQRQLPTIRSRCQVVRFQPLSQPQLTSLALRLGLAKDTDQANEIAAHCRGSLDEFRTLSNPELREFQGELRRQLSSQSIDISKFAKGIQSNVESAGSESQQKRERLKLLIDMTQQFFREDLARHAAIDSQRVERSIQAMKRCQEATMHVDRMVAPGAIIEAWVCDLATLP